MEDGADADLKALRRELDEAVADCYGWPKATAQDDKEVVARLTELNRQNVEGEREYSPFGYLEQRDQSSGAPNGNSSAERRRRQPGPAGRIKEQGALGRGAEAYPMPTIGRRRGRAANLRGP